MSKKKAEIAKKNIEKIEKTKPVNFEDKVMGKIIKEKITLRSKYLFLAQSIGITSFLLFTAILSVFFLNLFLYTLKANDSLSFLSFGSFGFFSFLEMFPYEFVIISIILFILLGFLWKKFDILYKHSFQKVLVVLIFLVTIISLALTFSGMNEGIHEQLQAGHFPGFRPFYGRVMDEGKRLKRGLIGRVIMINDKFLQVQAENKEVKVIFSEKTHFVDGKEFEPEQWIMTDGQWQTENEFLAEWIKHVQRRFRKEPMVMIPGKVIPQPFFNETSEMMPEEDFPPPPLDR